MKRLFSTLLFIILLFPVARFCKIQTDGFTLLRISSTLSYNPLWETAPPSELEILQLKKIVSQPYSYLAKGAQSYVFASQDGKYVIKFFRQHHLRAPFWQKALPFDRAKKSVQKKESKLTKDFASYLLAYRHLPQETGLIFLHLNKTSHLNLNLDLVDKLGIHHTLPLDQYEFLIQKRATLVYPALEQMMAQKQPEQAKKALSSLVHLLALRMQSGIFDKDPDLNTNFGFIGTEAIQIDFGRYKAAAPYLDKPAILRITDHLHQWLMEKFPELDDHLRQTIEGYEVIQNEQVKK